jgi:hypothetical protein
MVGPTLGGGIGRYNGLHGMISDALLSAQLVTAAGDIVTASTSENSELFWGMRGVGFNFGIVVAATYQVYDLTNGGVVINADFLFPAFQYFKSLGNDLPAELALIFQTGCNLDFGAVGLVALYSAALEVDYLSFSRHILSSMPPMQGPKTLAPICLNHLSTLSPPYITIPWSHGKTPSTSLSSASRLRVPLAPKAQPSTFTVGASKHTMLPYSRNISQICRGSGFRIPTRREAFSLSRLSQHSLRGRFRMTQRPIHTGISLLTCTLTYSVISLLIRSPS